MCFVAAYDMTSYCNVSVCRLAVLARLSLISYANVSVSYKPAGGNYSITPIFYFLFQREAMKVLEGHLNITIVYECPHL